MYKIILGELVEDDLNFISDIIFRFTFSKQIVDKIYELIVSNIYSLSLFPNRCKKYKYLRVMNIKWKYKVFYKIDIQNLQID